jgi:hypothetical protein
MRISYEKSLKDLQSSPKINKKSEKINFRGGNDLYSSKSPKSPGSNGKIIVKNCNSKHKVHSLSP